MTLATICSMGSVGAACFSSLSIGIYFYHSSINLTVMPSININELSLVAHFAPSEIKHMMPVYRQNTLHNLFCIFKYFLLSQYPIPRSLNNSPLTPLYQKIVIVWENDFDDEAEHLKNTLHLGAAIINYIYQEDKQAEQEKQPKKPPSHAYVKRVDTLECKEGTVFKNKSKYDTVQGKRKIIGYNFIKAEGRVFAIFAYSEKERDNSAVSSAILRQWNLSRLKINQIGQQIQTEHLHRLVEHLFGICRGFMREVSDDYNTLRSNLRNFMTLIERSQFHEAQILHSLKQSKLDNIGRSGIIQIITYHITFREELSQQDLWNIVKESVTQWLLKSPISISCSYAASLVYQEGTHNLILTLSTSYNKGQPGQPEQTDNYNPYFQKVASNVQGLMLDNIQKSTEPQNPNQLKQSMEILSKYQVPIDNQFMKSSRISNRSFTALNRSFQDGYRLNKSLNQSMMSDSPSRISLKRIAKLENQIYEILKVLQSNHKVLTPFEIEREVRRYATALEKEYKKIPGYGITREDQYEAMRTLEAMNEEISPEDIYALLKHHPNETGIILDGFLQSSRYDNAIILGKIIAKDHLESLYSMSLQFGLSQHRHSLLPFFLKKIVMKYGKVCKWSSLQADSVSVPQLVEVIQDKKYDSHQYSAILSAIFTQLFQNYEESIKPIAPLICLYLQFLLRQDHHFQIVYSFIGDLMYEVLYFTHQLKLNGLSNSMYFQQSYLKTLTIKQKRIYFMLREGGFRGFGYEIKNILLSTLNQFRNYRYPEPFIYHLYIVQKKTDLLKLFRLVSSSHHTGDIIKVGKFLQRRNNYVEALDSMGPLLAFFLAKPHDTSRFEEDLNSMGNEAQFHSLTEQLLRSESGIFQDMVRLNPKVKIAGIQLNTVMKNLSDSRRSSAKPEPIAKGCINIQEAVQFVVTDDLRRSYQFVELAAYLKERYVQYHTLNESEKQYFRTCADNAIEQKKKIVEYVVTSSKVKKQMDRKEKQKEGK